MKDSHFRSTCLIRLAAFVVFAASSLVNAQTRPFTNDNGTVIQAELVSHKGDKVKLRRTDGKEFEVIPSIFSNEDEAYIKSWMAKTPATKNYNFKIAITKKKIEGNSINMGYKRVKNDLWSYVLSVTNGSQDPVSKLTVKYRVFYSNAAEGSYSSYDERSPLRMTEGSEKIDAELPFNGIREIITTPVQIDIVDYDGVGDRYKDQLKGCIVRIVDENDNVVFDWVSPEVGMKGRGWLNTNPSTRQAPRSTIVR
jgi:hypothetical protein